MPVYGNESSLRELHRRLADTMEIINTGFEVIFVDDGSPDGSLVALNELAAEDRRTRILPLAKNCGQSRAITAALRIATGARIVTLDADLQDPPEAIPQLLEVLGGRDGAVFAGRRGSYESVGRRLTSRIYKGILKLMTGMPRDAGAFVAMSRAVADRIIEMKGGRASLSAMIALTGFPMTSVPIRRNRRPQGRSAYTSRRRLSVASSTLFFVIHHRLRGAARVNLPGPRTTRGSG